MARTGMADLVWERAMRATDALLARQRLDLEHVPLLRGMGGGTQPRQLYQKRLP